MPLTISKPGGAPVITASILAVMSLGVSQADDVLIATAVEDIEGVLDRLAGLPSADLDAPAAG